jgi:hypothetical protein
MASLLQNTGKVASAPEADTHAPSANARRNISQSSQASKQTAFNPLQQRLQQVTAGVANFCAI